MKYQDFIAYFILFLKATPSTNPFVAATGPSAASSTNPFQTSARGATGEKKRQIKEP